MATIQEIIRRVDRSKPNAFDDKIKMRWISLLDGKIAVNVLLLDSAEATHVEYTREEDLVKEPLVSFPYDDIYDLWLSAQIDFCNGEYDRYQNTMEMFNAHYMDYVKYVADNFDPVQQGGCCRGNNRFYLTAYGLAVKHGFAGTEEEWLASLVGQAPVFQIGNVTTVPYGTLAEVSLRGTVYNPILDFEIPRGFSAEDAAEYCEQAAQSAENAAASAKNAEKSAAETAQHGTVKDNPHGVTAAQAGALPALESEEYPGCYYYMTDGKVEWINPPLDTGVEYRTTERWFGYPVYKKLVDIGYLPAADSYKKVVLSSNEYVTVLSLEGRGYLDSDGAGWSHSFPYHDEDDESLGAYVYTTASGGGVAIVVVCVHDYSNQHASFVTKYVKRR